MTMGKFLTLVKGAKNVNLVKEQSYSKKKFEYSLTADEG